MSCILNIDTSTNVCSVAVSQDGTCIFDKQDTLDPKHREKLGTFVDEALASLIIMACHWMQWLLVVVQVHILVCVSVFLWQRESAMGVA